MKMIDEIDGEADLPRNGKESDIELEREDTVAAYGVDGAAATSIERTWDAITDEDACMRVPMREAIAMQCRCESAVGERLLIFIT